MSRNDDQQVGSVESVQSEGGHKIKAASGRGWRFIMTLFIVLLFVTLGFGFWQGYHLSLRVDEQGQRLKIVQPALDQARDRLAQTDAQVEAQASAQAQFLQSLKEQTRKIDGLNQRASQQGLTWQLAEIQTQLRMAALAINAFQDVGLALEFLRAAKKAAGDLDYSALVLVAAAINKDIAALAVIPEINRTELYLTMDQLRLTLDGLAVRQPPAQMGRTEAEPIVLTGSTFERLGRLLQSLLDRFSHLVDFRRGQPGPGPIPTPAEETVLRQNIALSLTTAQIALLRREQVVFERSLDRVSTLLDHYYDSGAEPVISAQSVIKALKTTPLGIDLPSVDHSLAALEAARLTLGERP